MSIDVSVQICTYNRPEMAVACLDSLREQTFPGDRFEVILVDDGSDDDRRAAIDVAAFPFALRVVRLEHGGLARARNAGIRAAAGEVVLFLDDDTIPDRRLIEEHWHAHRQHPRAVVLGWVNHVDRADIARPRRRRLADFSTSFFWTANASVRRCDLLAAGLFDESFTEYGWEDLEIGDRLRALGLARRFNGRAVVSHVKRRWRGSDLPGLLRQAEASGRSAVVYVRKRPSRRARLATGISPLRMAMNRMLEAGEGWYRRRVERAGDVALQGLDWAAAYLWTRVAYFRSVRAALGSGPTGVKIAAGWSPTPRVCVLRIDKIGDLLVTTPALRSLRAALPGAHITLVTSPACADVLRGWDAIDAIEIFDPRARRDVRTDALHRLRALRPDVIFEFTPKSSIYWLARRMGAPVRVGFGYRSRPLDVAVGRLAFTHPVFTDVPEAIDRSNEVRHHAEEMLWLLHAVGLPATPSPMQVPIDDADKAWAAERLASGGCDTPPILLHLSDKWLDDGWDPHDVVSLLDVLARMPARTHPREPRTLPLVVTVGPSDARVWSAVRPLLAGRSRPPLVVENPSFGRWAALISASAVVVSPDTGAIHLASATRRPVVGVYAAHRFHVFSRQWGPWMVPSRTLAKERGACGTQAIADAVEDLLREIRAVVPG